MVIGVSTNQYKAVRVIIGLALTIGGTSAYFWVQTRSSILSLIMTVSTLIFPVAFLTYSHTVGPQVRLVSNKTRVVVSYVLIFAGIAFGVASILLGSHVMGLGMALAVTVMGLATLWSVVFDFSIDK